MTPLHVFQSALRLQEHLRSRKDDQGDEPGNDDPGGDDQSDTVDKNDNGKKKKRKDRDDENGGGDDEEARLLSYLDQPAPGQPPNRDQELARQIVLAGKRARGEVEPAWFEGPKPFKTVKVTSDQITAAAQKARAPIPPTAATGAAKQILDAAELARNGGRKIVDRRKQPTSQATALAIVNAGRKARGEPPLAELPA